MVDFSRFPEPPAGLRKTVVLDALEKLPVIARGRPQVPRQRRPHAKWRLSWGLAATGPGANRNGRRAVRTRSSTPLRARKQTHERAPGVGTLSGALVCAATGTSTGLLAYQLMRCSLL
jgi:hypothetical protein